MAVGTKDPQGRASQLLALPRGYLGAGVTSLTPSRPSSSLSTQRGHSPPGLGERGGPPMPSWKRAAALSLKATPPWRGQAQGQGETLSIPLEVGNLGCQGNLASTSSWSHSCKPLMAEQSAGGSVGGRGPEHRRVPGARQPPASKPGRQDGVKSFSLPQAVSSQPGRGRGPHPQEAVSCWQGPEPSTPRVSPEPPQNAGGALEQGGAPRHWAQKLFVGIGAAAPPRASQAARW